MNVVDCFSAHERVDAAGVVADHTADGTAAVRGGVGREGQGEFLCGVADAVEHDSRLDVNGARVGVDSAHSVHVLRKVEDDGSVAALTGERSAGSAGEDGRVEATADCDGCDDVGFVARDDDADGNVAIVRGVGGVEGFVGGVEADLAADLGAEFLLEFFGLSEGVV